MRALKIVMTGLCVTAMFGPAIAAPISGYEALYSANYTACVLPDGTVEACEQAIQAHIGALLSGNIEIDQANASFQELRREVYVANEPDKKFQALIDALFDQLLPNSGSIGGGGTNVLTNDPEDGGSDGSPQ